MANQTMKLTVGGPVQAKSGTYLSRPADEELLKAGQTGTFAYVLACRQIGKSSLMFETSRQLSRAGARTAVIDLNSIGQSVEADNWYFSLIDELARNLKLEVDVQTWWDSRPRLLTLTRRFLQFLREVVLNEIPEPIVVFVDEIDVTLGLDFTDDFFAAIRSIHNERAQYPAYNRLTFVLLGVATPDELIQDHTRTPFNIGQSIALRDFTKEECEPFRLEIEARYPPRGRRYFDQVYEWTGGHPYLMQKLCQAILSEDASEFEDGSSAFVDMLVRRLFLAAEARSEDNIQFVQTRVTNDPDAQEMLKTYKRILADETPVYDDEQSPAVNRLKLYGLVVAQNGKLEIRNKIYAHAFDLSWATEMLRLSNTRLKLELPERYKILQEIGQGGFATVYLTQLRDAGKTQSVALKVLKPQSVDDTNQVKRFKQEARAVANLDHPNIIRILDTGGDEEPFFIAMDYIPGGTLADRLKTGPLPRNEAVHIVRDIGAALSQAHAEEIIHRDIKPGNILLDTGHKPMRPVLTDFGLIKILAGDDYTKIHSTNIMGTLGYMAPEQWRQETPTPATDVYALAITFFEMLAGQCPFDSQTGYYSLMTQHLEEPLPALSSVAPEVGSFFDDVLQQAAAKDQADRFGSIIDFIEAIVAANDQAEQVERVELQDQAAKAVELAQNFIQRGRYDPEKALPMIEMALDIYPGYLDALRLRAKMRFRQGQFEAALADYERAYEQEAVPASEIGLEYLEVLSQVAQTSWQRQMYPDAATYYETIRQILAGQDCEAGPIQEIWQTARTRLAAYHHYEGDAAYAGGQPEDIDQAINVLGREIQLLEPLKTDRESRDLRDKLRLLQVKKYENIVEVAQTALDEINTKDSHIRYGNEDIFQHYLTLDQAYQALIELEPENKQWPEIRRRKLRERAESRCVFAIRALGKLEPDYESALRHYKAVLAIEQTHYPGLTQELHLDLNEEITKLQAKVDYDGKYNDILKLIEGKDYSRALDRLDQEFIQAGNYEHREVTRWLWGLVYAKRHAGKLPPEWESLSGFESLSKRLVQLERVQIQKLKGKVEPWSQAKILRTIDHHNRLLGDYETQVKDIERLISEAVAHGVAETADIEKCRDELMELGSQIQDQRGVIFRVDVNETAQNVEAWLQKIEDIEALLQTGNPLKDIPEFLNKIDEEQQTIEKNPIFEALQTLVSTSAEIGQTINRVKLHIRRRLVRILIDDVGRRDEELVETRREAATARAELAEAQKRESSARQKTIAIEKQHRMFAVSIVPALILGAVIGVLVSMIASEVQNLFGIIVAAVITILFWLLWVYFQSRRY